MTNHKHYHLSSRTLWYFLLFCLLFLHFACENFEFTACLLLCCTGQIVVLKSTVTCNDHWMQPWHGGVVGCQCGSVQYCTVRVRVLPLQTPITDWVQSHRLHTGCLLLVRISWSGPTASPGLPWLARQYQH